MVSEYVTLLGAEKVQNAGHAMERAAESMRQSAGYIDESLRAHQRFLDDWLQRWAAEIEKQRPPDKDRFEALTRRMNRIANMLAMPGWRRP